jgi:hypothetical protein
LNCSDGTSQRTSSLSRAEPNDFGLELFKPRASKIKLFKPDNSKNQAFQAWPKNTFLVYFILKILYTSIFTAEGSHLVLIFTTKMIFV